VAGGDSGHLLAMPTFADVMRSARGAHVVSLSLKTRGAIIPAGHGGDAVTWLSDAGDGWVTSSVFADGPVPAVQSFIDANPIDADFGKTWTRMLPAARYQGPDDGEGEAPPKGWTRTFPHELKGAAGSPDPAYRTFWQRSPFADAYVGRFAAALAESLQLGKHGTTDVLAVSFSSPAKTVTRVSGITVNTVGSIGSTRSSAVMHTSSRSAPTTAPRRFRSRRHVPAGMPAGSMPTRFVTS